MKINIGRDELLGAVQAVVNVVERRQTLPILSNILISAESTQIRLTATDMEVEVIASVSARVLKSGVITVPGRKLLDICRALPVGCEVDLEVKDKKVRVQSGRSRFVLSTLPAEDYPLLGRSKEDASVVVPASVLRDLIGRTQFAMAHQDVRYYLNGLLLEVTDGSIKAVATDGHRLALCERAITGAGEGTRQLIIPRKGVAEIQRLISHAEGEITVALSSNQIGVAADGQSVTVKLVDGRFPDYERVIPKTGDKVVIGDREAIRAALQRTSILSNEKFRGVRLTLKRGLLKTAAHNPEQEEAEEEIEVEYEGEELEVGFNVSYLLDVLAVLPSEKVKIELMDANSSCLLEDPDDPMGKFVVMPMRL